MLYTCCPRFYCLNNLPRNKAARDDALFLTSLLLFAQNKAKKEAAEKDEKTLDN
jgi:hypothetical protein